MVETRHDPVPGRTNGVLHLHCFEDQYDVSFGDSLATLDGSLSDPSGHGREKSRPVIPGCGAHRPRRSGTFAADLEDLSGTPDEDPISLASDPNGKKVFLHLQRHELAIPPDLAEPDPRAVDGREILRETNLTRFVAGLQSDNGHQARHPGAEAHGSLPAGAAVPSRSAIAAAIQTASGTGARAGRDSVATRSVL